ncbi:MAG: class I SAM-dependent methyltransferase [Thermodesulfobacteriota bacterium]
MTVFNTMAKRCINFILKFMDDEKKLAVLNLISSTLNCGAEHDKYGKMPLPILNYESLYRWDTGGWHNPNAQDQLDYASVELEVGRFFYAFVLLTQPKTILETGVYKGYSTCNMASALKLLDNGGHIYCIDPMETRHLWEDTDLESLISWIPRLSQESLDTLRDKKFDLLVLDSDHSYDTAMWELINFERMLSEGGHILMHDSIFFDGVGAAVKQLYDNPRFEVITLNTPRKSHLTGSRCPGVTIARKKSDEGPELVFEDEFKGWFVGDRTAIPYLRRT